MDVKTNFRKSVLELSPYGVSGHPAKIKLNQNESPFDIPSELKKELVDEFFKISWNRYPEVFSTELPKRFSNMYDLPVESFIVSNGSNELIYTVLMSIVEDRTEVVIPQPTFYLFEKVVRILGGKISRVFADDSLAFDGKEIIDAAAKIDRGLVIIGSPNNPTGKSLRREEIEDLLRGTKAMVLLDEAYIEFSEHPSCIDLIKTYKNFVVLRTFSKAFSLAGLRIGYLAAHPDTAREILKVKIPFTVNPLSEFTALKLLEHRDLFTERVASLVKQKCAMMSGLKSMRGVKVVESDSNFFLFSTPHPGVKVFEDLLERKSVLVRDVSSYPLLENYLRVNAGSEEESEYFVSALREVLK